jgi:hypothetical protein
MPWFHARLTRRVRQPPIAVGMSMVIEKLVGIGLKRCFSLGFISSLWHYKLGIKGTGAHFHHAAQYANWERLLLRSNKSVFFSTSLASMPAAFFNISRSMRNCSFSLRSRNNSAWLVKLKAAVLLVDGVVGLRSALGLSHLTIFPGYLLLAGVYNHFHSLTSRHLV